MGGANSFAKALDVAPNGNVIIAGDVKYLRNGINRKLNYIITSPDLESCIVLPPSTIPMGEGDAFTAFPVGGETQNLSYILEDVDLITANNFRMIEMYSSLDIDDLHNQTELLIYTNPARDRIYVESKILMDKIKLISPDGKVILRKPVQDQSSFIETSHLPSGVYFLVIDSVDGRTRHKMVIE